ncbi:MAG: MMPL family transporter [Firmicutes bacterium]|nr:MMPL family transporter [Bacillota bacterium]
MATSFYVLLLAPLPFLRAAGFLIGTNVVLDTLVIRTLLMPTTYAAFLEADPARRPWRQRFDHWLALLALGWALLAIPTLIGRDRQDLHIVPAPLPIQIVSTRHHPIQFF